VSREDGVKWSYALCLANELGVSSQFKFEHWLGAAGSSSVAVLIAIEAPILWARGWCQGALKACVGNASFYERDGPGSSAVFYTKKRANYFGDFLHALSARNGLKPKSDARILVIALKPARTNHFGT
jgi:hypothetical protein